jgi:hypothetical protein
MRGCGRREKKDRGRGIAAGHEIVKVQAKFGNVREIAAKSL